MDLTLLSVLDPWDWPADAEESLLAVLRDSAAPEADRELAAELASETAAISDELATSLLEIVRDSEASEHIRGRAAIALGPVLEQMDLDVDDADEFADDLPISPGLFGTIKDALRHLFLDAATPRDVRRRVLQASVRSPMEWHRGAVRAAFYDQDPLWKLTAVFCMGYVGDFSEEIVAALQDPDEGIRFEAVRAAGNLGVAAAYPEVAKILSAGETADRTLILAAIEAIVYIRPEEAADLLANLIDSDDEEIADAATEAIDMAQAIQGGGSGFEDL